MRKYSINYKKFIPFLMLIIIISSLGIFIFEIENAKADVGEYIIGGLKGMLADALLTIQELVGSLVAWMAGLAQGILNFTSLQNSQMVKDGWEITRGLVNMFFILILMVIALATILKVESYGMKQLLPKLIIAALLINFSLVFCGAIIDSAGVLTNYFIKDSKNFFENIANQMQLTTIMKGSGKDTKIYECHTLNERDGPIFNTLEKCQENCTGSNKKTCITLSAPSTKWNEVEGDLYWKVIAALFLSIIFTIIAVFVFAALAFLLLIRVLVIWFLLILAPVAWFFWILPATKNLWEKWWNTFIKWVFFAPAAIFFIWLSVNSWLKFIEGKAPMTGGEIIKGMSETITNDVLKIKIMPQVMAPGNFIQFILACGMLIGSLIVAQKIGIYGASGAINIAKSAGKGVGRWTARPPKALATATGVGAASLTGKIMKKIPLKASQKLGRRIEARGTALKQSPEERPEHKKYSNLIKMMSDNDVLKEAKTARGIRSFIAAKELQQRRTFKTADSKDIQSVMETLERFKADKELRTAQEIRPDTIKDRKEKEIVINRVVQEGNLNKLPAIALQDEELIATLAKFASASQIGKLHDTSPDHAKDMDASLSKLVAHGNPVMNALNVTEQEKIHFTYASQTGDVSRMSSAQKGDWAKQAGQDGLKKLRIFNPANDSEVALNIPAHQLNKIITGMNRANVATDLVHYLNANGSQSVKDVIDADPTLSNM